MNNRRTLTNHRCTLIEDTKKIRQQRRNECFQQCRLFAATPTPKKIKNGIRSEENNNKRNQNRNNIKSDFFRFKGTDSEKPISIKSKSERQEVFSNKYNEWKRQKEIRKLELKKNTAPKPFVTGCFKNSLFSEYLNTIKPLEAKNKRESTKFKFQMKNYVLLPPQESVESNLLPHKKSLKSSENTYRNTTGANANNIIIRKPLKTFNNNARDFMSKQVMHRNIKSVMKSPTALTKSTKLKHPVIKKEIQKPSVNTNNNIRNIDPSGSNNNYVRKNSSLRGKKKNVKNITETKGNDTTSEMNSILRFSNFHPTKSLHLTFTSSTLPKNETPHFLPFSSDLDELEIKHSASIKNSCMENDFNRISTSTPVHSFANRQTLTQSTNEKNQLTGVVSGGTVCTRKERENCNSIYSMDINLPRKSISKKTTEIINNPENQNYYMSPQVAVSRGKVSARKEREKRDSIYLTDIDSPRKSILKRTKETICYFRSQLKDEEARLLKLCSDWLDYLNTLNSSVIIDIAGPMVNAAIGVTNLLISKKMNEFNRLIERCEETVTTNKFDNVNVADINNSLKPVEIQDLEGFWSIIRRQIEDLEKRFNNLVRWRDNDWNDPYYLLEPTNKKERTRNNVIEKKKNVLSNIKSKKLRKRIGTECLRDLQASNSGLNTENKAFEVFIPSKLNLSKLSNEDKTKQQKYCHTGRNDSIRLNRTAFGSRKISANTENIIENCDLLSKNLNHSMPQKSILKTPGSLKKAYKVKFYHTISEFKNSDNSDYEYYTPEESFSLDNTHESKRYKTTVTKN